MALFALEVTGGIAFGSLALLADAADRVSDVIALGMAIAAVVLAARPVTSGHSFGFARVEVMAGQVTALIMLVAGLWIVTEALDRLRDPVPVDGAGLAAVAALGLVFNGAGAALVRRDQGQSLNMRACFAHLATDAAGSLAALIAGLTILAWGWTRADAVASLGTAILILWAASRLLRESIHVFMEAAPRGLDPQQVRAVIQAVDGVVDVHHLHLWSLASDIPACSAHVVLANQPTLAEAQQSGMAIKAALADQFALTRVTLELEDTPAAPRMPDVTFVEPAVMRPLGRTG
jgi:cobalt-zinc-cadmium efflux system protein